MPNSLLSRSSPTPPPRIPFYPADLLPALRDALSALADIDLRYATERDRLDKTAGSPEAKHRLLEALASRHETRREPHVRQLGELQRRMAMLLQRR